MTQGLERRIDSIRLENLLSFRCAELELRNLNVLIGPNGSGKSNLLTAFEILRGVRDSVRAALRNAGGIELRRRGPSLEPHCRIRVEIQNEAVGGIYDLEFDPARGGVEHEAFGSGADFEIAGFSLFRDAGSAYVVDENEVTLPLDKITQKSPMRVGWGASAFSLFRDPQRFLDLALIGDGLEDIRVARQALVGPASAMRVHQSVLEDETQLKSDSSNLALVLNNLTSTGLHDKIDEYLSRFLSSYKRLTFRIEDGAIRMFLAERGVNDPIPASRFSDGTLAFLRLFSLIYERSLPTILAIEEPEAGLHPDAVRLVAEMLKNASQRKQILVTTHSPELVDALSDDPEAIVVCEKDEENGTQFRRLSSKDMAAWLEHYTLGELWTKGEIGGNRW